MHTPLPWTRDGLNIVGKDRTVVAMVNRPSGDTTRVAFDNLDLILAAINSRDSLMAVVEWALEDDDSEILGAEWKEAARKAFKEASITR